MIVKLQPDEVLICEQLGRMRSIIARSSGVKDAKVGTQDGSEADVMGMKAEYAFAKQFNTFPDLGLTPRSGSADGKLKGYAYDIKSTTYKSGRLLATKKRKSRCRYVCAMYCDNSEVDIKGYAMKKDLIQPSNLKNLGHGEGYCMDQNQLTKFK